MGIEISSGGVSKTYRYYPYDAFYVDANGNVNTSGNGQQVKEAWFNGVKYYPEVTPPNRIAVTVPPSKLSYLLGDTIDYTGMVVTAYSPDGSPYDTSRYPNGVIPLAELVLQPTVYTDAPIGVGRRVPQSLRDYLGTSPVLATSWDVEYPRSSQNTNYLDTLITYILNGYGNGASVGVALFEQADPFTDSHDRRRATVQGQLLLVSENPFSFTFTSRTRVYASGDDKNPEITDLISHTKSFEPSYTQFGFSFLYDTYNNKTIYVVAPHKSAVNLCGDYLTIRLDGGAGNGATTLDSSGDARSRENPDGLIIRSPHNIVNRCPLACNASGNYKYGQYNGTFGYAGKYSDMSSGLQKILADIAIYLLYGNITMNDINIPVSWTSPNGDILTTSVTIALKRHSDD